MALCDIKNEHGIKNEHAVVSYQNEHDVVLDNCDHACSFLIIMTMFVFDNYNHVHF